MGQGFPGGEERNVGGGQVGAQGCGEVFCLTVGGGDDEAERFGGGIAYCGGDVCNERGVGSGDGADEGACATFSGLRGGGGTDRGPAAELVEGFQEGVQGCLEGLCGSFSGGAHGFS